jgi:ferric-dicitrate binding protein FerR (iron transport regulator)
MKQENRHTDKHDDPKGLSDLLSSGMKIPWEKSKAQVWDELERKIDMEDRSPEPVVRTLSGRQWFAMAATVALLLSVAGFMRFYTVKTFCPDSVHASVELPDGSDVELNASTRISYHPYWWFISREVKLDGEAFFQVEKGKKFRVVSSNATTEVLGTTFNVFARGEDYIVTCHTGSVKVIDRASKKSVILSPEEKSVLNPTGGFTVSRVPEPRTEPGWTKNLIMFGSTPLQLVFEEVERQFGIVIETTGEVQEVYSGNFSLDQPVENILSLLCVPFDLEYERQSGNKYLVYPSPE